MPQIQDRIVRLDRVKKKDLLANPENWRKHPAEQRSALREMLGAVGHADALLARETPQGLVLIDGHLRLEVADDNDELPVLVLDVDEDEARKLLLTLDPLRAMATTDHQQLAANVLEVMPAPGIEEIIATLGQPEGDGTGTRRTAMPRAVVQYKLQFVNVEAQERWFRFVQFLNARYPAAGTIGERVDLYVAEAQR